MNAASTLAALAERMRSAGRDPSMLDGLPPQRIRAIASGELHRDGLCRTFDFRATDNSGELNSDGLTIEGYGAVFNVETHIRSWEGDFIETIAPGAFRKTFREVIPKLQFDHGHHPLLGGLPLGRWHEAREDDHGAFGSGRMYDNWLVLPFRDAIADGAVDAQSFRFSVVKEEWRDVDGKKITDDHELFELIFWGAGERGPITRTLREVKCPEMGPVVWPAYKETSVGARSANPDGGPLSGIVTIDLARVGRPDYARTIAEVTAALDSAIAHAGRTSVVPVRNTETVDTGSEDSAPVSGVQDDEPHATVDTAADHSPDVDDQRDDPPADDQGEPVGTDTPTAGEHSRSGDTPAAPVGPASPAGRRDDIRARLRQKTDRVFAAQRSHIDE